ncbi:MAG: pepsin/retropepsin-like aspartic protease family protein [Verrucomicrobiota bacterium]
MNTLDNGTTRAILPHVIRRVLLFGQGTLSILFAALFFAAPVSDAKPEARGSAPSDFDALPLTRSRQNHLLVRAYINGKPAWLGVDSGAPVSAIALHRRAHFRVTGIGGNPNLPSKVQINGAFNNVGIVRKFRLGSLELVDEPVVLVDLGNSTRSPHRGEEQEIDGILGADILFPTNAVLDCQRRILFLKSDPNAVGNTPGFDRRGFQAVPIQVSDGFNLYVTGSVNDAPAKLMVDTGSFATLLHRSFVRRMKIPTRETPFRSAAVNLKQRGVRMAYIRKLSVGSVDFAGKDVGVVDLEGLIHGRLLEGTPPVAGLLGAEILNRYHGVIDFGNRTLYLKREGSPIAVRERSADGSRAPRARPVFPE